MRTDVRWLVLVALASASCYATYDRGVAAANAHDWPKAETELWRYLMGSDCVGRPPILACKQAAVRLGEVLVEDDRPTTAASVFRFTRKVFGKKPLGTPEINQDLDARIVKGYDAAKQRWDQFRSGKPGQCQIVARYVGPGSGLQLTSISSGLDRVRLGAATGPAEPPVLFETSAAAGPHAITVDATFIAPKRQQFHQSVETTYFRSCEDGERVELVFQVRQPDPTRLKVDVAATCGRSVPLEGPLRPNPALTGL
jgi:hypothetical protein